MGYFTTLTKDNKMPLVLTFVVALLLVTVALFPAAFVVMLLLGSLHLNGFFFVPALGFWAVWKILLLLRVVGGVLFNHSTSTTK